MQASAPSAELTIKQRYLKLAVLVIVAGNIYPLIYLRQNFEVSILESFNMTAAQLEQNTSILGLIYILTYLPSGWLADRVSPKILMSFSLLCAGLLGVWFSTFPSFEMTQIIFAGWGISAGLTFWAALIKATTLLAKPDEQGRFFGILDGGRGLVEAVLASIALGIFAYSLNSAGQDTAVALKKVIWLYVTMMLVLAPISYLVLDDPDSPSSTNSLNSNQDKNFWRDLKLVLMKEEIWLCGICILTGYQLFFATYSFSGYLETYFGLSAVAAGFITVAKLWMRPIGAVAAGFAGDFFEGERVLGILMVFASISLAMLAFLPTNVGVAALLTMVLTIGLLTYAVRGIFWATLESCNVSARVKGLAIGIISLIGYSPDYYLPKLKIFFEATYNGKLGYTYYYGSIAMMGVLGALAVWRLKYLVSNRERLPE